jgi:hypothetical protein
MLMNTSTTVTPLNSVNQHGTSVKRRRRRAKVMFAVPESFDACQMLPPNLKKYADCANYLIHSITRATMMWKLEEDGFLRLRVCDLRRLIPDRIERPLRKFLIECGVLACDYRFEPGVKSLGYKLNLPIYPLRWVRCSDKRLIGKLREIERKARAASKPLKVHDYLANWVERLEIDEKMARAAVMKLDNRHIHLSAIEFIARGEIKLTHCQMGRVHTNITRLACELRPALRIGGVRDTSGG